MVEGQMNEGFVHRLAACGSPQQLRASISALPPFNCARDTVADSGEGECSLLSIINYNYSTSMFRAPNVRVYIRTVAAVIC